MDQLTKQIDQCLEGDTRVRLANLPILNTKLKSFFSSKTEPSSSLLSSLLNLFTVSLKDNNGNVKMFALDLITLVSSRYTANNNNNNNNTSSSNSLTPYLSTIGTSLSASVFGDAKAAIHAKTIETVTNLLTDITKSSFADISVSLHIIVDSLVKSNMEDKNWRVRLTALQVYELVLSLDGATKHLSAKVKARKRIGGSSNAASDSKNVKVQCIDLLGDKREEGAFVTCFMFCVLCLLCTHTHTHTLTIFTFSPRCGNHGGCRNLQDRQNQHDENAQEGDCPRGHNESTRVSIFGL